MPDVPEPRRAAAPIGVFDSGVGGLSVVRALRRKLPAEDILYLADSLHVPYGSRPLEQVRQFATEIVHFLLGREAKLIVVACNTASAAALHELRARFSGVRFVGMEPAVKPAAEHTRSKVVGVLATPATFQGKLYASVVERFASGVRVLQATCPGLVEQIEAGELSTPETRRLLAESLQDMLAAGVDTIVLGCTHFPFVIPLIEDIAGPGVRVIDPAPAIARQTARVLAQENLSRPTIKDQPISIGRLACFTTGPRDHMQAMLALLLGEAAPVQPLRWTDGRLTFAS